MRQSIHNHKVTLLFGLQLEASVRAMTDRWKHTVDEWNWAIDGALAQAGRKFLA